MKRLGTLLRAARERRGLRGYEVAARLGKQPSYVTRLETGETKTLPPPEELTILGDVLDLTMPEMLDAAGYAVDEPRAEGDALDAICDDWRPLMREVAWTPARVEFVKMALRHFADDDRQRRDDPPMPEAPDPPARTRNGRR